MTFIDESPDSVRRKSLRSVREQMQQITWLTPEDRACLERTMLEILPRWEAHLHSERRRKLAAGDTVAADMRAAGVMLLSNMLDSLARNTTAPQQGEDHEYREAAILRTIINLHALILENLLPKKRPTGDEALTVVLNRAIQPFFPDGQISVREIAIACGALYGGHLRDVPQPTRREMFEQFSSILRGIAHVDDSA